MFYIAPKSQSESGRISEAKGQDRQTESSVSSEGDWVKKVFEIVQD